MLTWVLIGCIIYLLVGSIFLPESDKEDTLGERLQRPFYLIFWLPLFLGVFIIFKIDDAKTKERKREEEERIRIREKP